MIFAYNRIVLDGLAMPLVSLVICNAGAQKSISMWRHVVKEDQLAKYRKKPGGKPKRLPTMEEVDRAVEQPGEADPETLDYVKDHPKLAASLRKSQGYKPTSGRGR